jgi:hypothetical protein
VQRVAHPQIAHVLGDVAAALDACAEPFAVLVRRIAKGATRSPRASEADARSTPTARRARRRLRAPASE